MADTIYQGDVGLEILVDCGRDLTGAAAPSTPKPITPMLPAGAPLAPHPDQAAIHRGGAPEDAGSAAPPPPSYLLACAFLI